MPVVCPHHRHCVNCIFPWSFRYFFDRRDLRHTCLIKVFQLTGLSVVSYNSAVTVHAEKPPPQRAELRDFLRSRRARLSPEETGIISHGRRRTPGLRREEVAVLAGVGVSWYTWLEQGRDIRVSSAVLDALARALQLDDTERAHLYRLCHLNPPDPAGRRRTLEVDRLRRIADGWSPNPAYVIDSYGDVIAANPTATSIFGVTDQGYNCPMAFFSDSLISERYLERDEVARRMVAHLRASAGRLLADAEFQRLIDRLHAASGEFAELWSRHEIQQESPGVVLFRHPRLGRLVFEQTALTIAEDPDLRLMVYLALPDDSGRLPSLALSTTSGAGRAA